MLPVAATVTADTNAFDIKLPPVILPVKLKVDDPDAVITVAPLTVRSVLVAANVTLPKNIELLAR